MFCQNCGTKLDEKAIFCPGCGSKIEITNTPTSNVEPAPQVNTQTVNNTANNQIDHMLYTFETKNTGYLVAGIIICACVFIVCIIVACNGGIPIPGLLVILGIDFIVIGTKKASFTVRQVSGVDVYWSGKHFIFSPAQIDYNNLRVQGNRLILNRVKFNGFSDAQAAYNAVMQIKPQV